MTRRNTQRNIKTGLTLKGRRHHTSRDAATKTSFVISHKIAKNSKPFSEGEFVKECLVDSAALICPEKKAAFEQVPLSRRTVTRRIEDIAGILRELSDEDWMADFAFAVDVTALMNELNDKLQGKGLFVHEMHSLVKAFMTKMVSFKPTGEKHTHSLTCKP